ncbi:MAG TPA: glycosyltransferase family 2 protein [Clostridia bacterium]|nr:glycosyltransferase family 2 protein [Clostridia bacterium]
MAPDRLGFNDKFEVTPERAGFADKSIDEDKLVDEKEHKDRRHGIYVAAIIPAFNEAPRVMSVIDVLKKDPLVDELVVVDDGSKDNTGEVARKAGIRTLRHPSNLGKGAALATGLRACAGASHFLFLDADLVGLTHEHVAALLKPVLEASGPMMSIGVFTKGRPFLDLAQHLTPILNGQRCINRQFADVLPDISPSRFGVEVLLNRYSRHAGLPYVYLPLRGLTHVPKEEKYGLLRGFIARIGMYKDVFMWAFRRIQAPD